MAKQPLQLPSPGRRFQPPAERTSLQTTSRSGRSNSSTNNPSYSDARKSGEYRDSRSAGKKAGEFLKSAWRVGSKQSTVADEIAKNKTNKEANSIVAKFFPKGLPARDSVYMFLKGVITPNDMKLKQMLLDMIDGKDPSKVVWWSTMRYEKTHAKQKGITKLWVTVSNNASPESPVRILLEIDIPDDMVDVARAKKLTGSMYYFVGKDEVTRDRVNYVEVHYRPTMNSFVIGR